MARETSKKSLALKALTIVALFIVLPATANVVREESNQAQSNHIESNDEVIENNQTVSNEKPENGLNRLQAYSSGDGRPGEYFYYRLDNVSKFFQLRNDVNTPVFTVKGIQ